MRRFFAVFSLLAVSCAVSATQETFITAGALSCGQDPSSSAWVCSQTTTDGLFTLKFAPTYPTSAPSPTGFNVNEPAIEIYSNGPSGLMDLNILAMSLTGSNFYNGVNFLGAIQLEVQDAGGNWNYTSQWSTWIGSSRGVYVQFRGFNASAPLVKGVRAIRLSGVNGATAFRIGMMNATAY